MRASCKFKTENEGRHVEWRVGKGLVLGFDFSTTAPRVLSPALYTAEAVALRRAAHALVRESMKLIAD